MRFQGRLVVSSLGRAQLVPVAGNFPGGPVTMSGAVDSDFGAAPCNEKTLATGSNHACHGPADVVEDCHDRGAGAADGPYGGTVRLTVGGQTAETSLHDVCLAWDEEPWS
ncbi:hypothetical protein [Streptomyces sp. NPDC050856]|uniref:hypothetical protein n=1 Tax=Streptomyces sp. NPDC050856 TaxID=3154939 RepID=UPI0033E25317